MSDPNAIQITIADAGGGMRGPKGGGHGMDNMQARAAAINGAIIVDSSAKGSAITLTVPLNPDVSTDA